MRAPLALSLVLAATAALADDGTAAAKAAAKEARVAFDAGDFERALVKYEEAFRARPVPALQFNLGQCHRQLGHLERALYFFRRFLESQPPEEQAAQVRPLVAELEAQQARDEAHARELQLEQARAASAQAQADLERALKQQPVVAAAEPPVYKKPWFWVVVGGVAVVAAGVGAGAYVATAPRPVATTWPDIDAR
ncbi:MAG: tetratricopeptide repeat protein [Archangiaceae bacterium]|nr:tetratricopeptide repeat protein [Archangiaceae bacterium]